MVGLGPEFGSGLVLLLRTYGLGYQVVRVGVRLWLVYVYFN